MNDMEQFAMNATYTGPSISLQEIVNNVFNTRKITRLDQQRFMMAALSDTVTATDHALINRVFDALQRGALRVVD